MCVRLPILHSPLKALTYFTPSHTQHPTYYSHQVTAIVKSSTVQTDDYLDLLMAAQLDCIPRPVPSEHQGQGHVALTITFPGQQPPNQEALAHFLDRLAHPEAVLSFGVDTLLTHPSLDREGSCVRHVPGKDPFFRVLSVAQQGSSLVLDLSPTSPQEAFRYLSLSLQHSPDAEGEVARRRALGQWTGRQLPVTYSKTIASYGINWNGNAQTPGAAIAKLPIFSAQPNALYCDNCFFYLGATLNINVQVCAIVVAAAVLYYYDASMPLSVVTSGYGYFHQTFSSQQPGYVSSSAAAAKAMTDCKALNTPDPLLFNVGFSAEAFFLGSAAFNFAIASDGITASPPLAFPSSCTAPSTSCTPTKLPGIDPVDIPTITVPVAGIPITIDPTITLSGAALGSLSMPSLVLRFGASASVSLKLGGKVSFAGLPSSGFPTLTFVPYSDFTSSFTQQPFMLSGFTAASGSIDATITPIISVKIWKILPFTIQPLYNMVHTLAVGTRQLGLRGGEEQEDGYLGKASAGGRALQAGCAAGQVSSKASAKGALGVSLDAVTAFSLINSVSGVDMSTVFGGVAKSADLQIIPTTIIVDPSSTSFAVDGAVPAAASACVVVGSAISTGGTLRGGGSGGSSGGGSSSGGDGAALSGGALIGVAVGAPVGILLLLGGLYFFFVLHRKASGAASAAKVVSSKIPAYASEAKAAASASSRGAVTTETALPRGWRVQGPEPGDTDVRRELEDGRRTQFEMMIPALPREMSWRASGASTLMAPPQQQLVTVQQFVPLQQQQQQVTVQQLALQQLQQQQQLLLEQLQQQLLLLQQQQQHHHSTDPVQSARWETP